VPNVTLNTGIYYGIQRHHRELIEPRFWLDFTGSQHLWNNNGVQNPDGTNSGIPGPSNVTMSSYATANMSFTAPISFEKQSFNLKVDMLNLANSKYNQWEYISSGSYFGSLFQGNSAPSGYINAYPGAPRSVYGTITYQF
ncbi:MAG: hypothetical protein ACLGXA_03105, partial [Acidobacteriota bacterium]